MGPTFCFRHRNRRGPSTHEPGSMRKDPWNTYELLAPVVEKMGYELLGTEYQGSRGSGTLRLYIDSPEGITLDDCEAVSFQVSGVLDVEDPIPGRYSLEVSSPGLDRPLFKPEHFERFAGQRAKLRTDQPRDGQRNFRGTLRGMRGDDVVLELEEGEEVALPLEDIERARLVPEP